MRKGVRHTYSFSVVVTVPIACGWRVVGPGGCLVEVAGKNSILVHLLHIHLSRVAYFVPMCGSFAFVLEEALMLNIDVSVYIYLPDTVQCRSYSTKTVQQFYNYSTVLGAAIKCRLYSEIKYSENWDIFKNCKITLNVVFLKRMKITLFFQ